jgi:hypothetical protein
MLTLLFVLLASLSLLYVVQGLGLVLYGLWLLLRGLFDGTY